MGLESKEYTSTCSYCGVGCGVRVSKDHRGRLQLSGDEASPVNRGALCSKGRYLHNVVSDQSDRLLAPQIRYSRSHPLQEATWDEALDRVSRVFKAIIDRHGPDSVGLYVSGQLLTEEYYIANKLMKGFIGSNNIDTNSRLCMSSAVAGYKKAFGDDLVPTCYEDIDESDCFFIAGANPAWCHPIVFRRMEARKLTNPDTKVIVVDPRATDTCSIADIHLQITPGTDVTLYNALARCIIEAELHDTAFIDAHVNGFDEMRSKVFQTPIDAAAVVCGIAESDLRTAAQWLGESDTFMSFWAMGLNQSAVGVDKNLALLNLSLVTGQIGKPGAGPFSLTGQPNAMGGREVGGLSNLLAAHRDLGNPAQREFVADYWGVSGIQEKPGLTATEMIDGLNAGTLKAIWIICTNPAVSLPNAHATEKALKNARFVVAQDISSRSDTVAYADAILPAAGWLEKQGTMTNSERRVTYLPKLVDAPGKALPDAEILCRFAAKMGWEDSFTYNDESDIFDEHVELTRGTAIDMTGLNYDRLKKGSVQWPAPDVSHPGTARLFSDGVFATVDGKANLFPISPEQPEEKPSDEYPFILTTGRIRDQWHTMTRTGKVSRLRQHIPQPFLEIHPDDATKLGIENATRVQVENGCGTVEVSARVTSTIKPGTVFLPMHWGRQLGQSHGRANNLTSTRVDPVSKEPDFKYATVSVSAVTVPVRKIVVIGAGAAAFEFIQAYRALNKTDVINVFGIEDQPFYNRIMLPDYVRRKQRWENIRFSESPILTNLNVSFHQGMGIQTLEPENKSIVTMCGRKITYDVLILATGSRASTPSGTPQNVENVHTLRNRADAERLRASVDSDSEVVIVGGGLLGIELADALNDVGARCTIIHRSAALMRGVIDDTASGLLREVIESRGIQVLTNDGVVRYYGDPAITGLQTRSGRRLNCDVVCIATGITPNAELAENAGLDVRRGVVVNEAMQTSDPDIFAIGEVAEVHTRIFGTTLAAQEQARIAAARIAGDESQVYLGTTPINVLKIRDFSLCSIGSMAESDNDVEEIIAYDKAARYYKKCCVVQDRLVGAILVGDNSELAKFRSFIELKTELDETRWTLLHRQTAQENPPRGRIVCSCYNVGIGNIEDAIEMGCNDLESIAKETCAGNGCGSCRSEIATCLEATEVTESSEVLV